MTDMKKILFLIIATGILLVSCEKEKIGTTETQKVAGHWMVTFDAIEEDGEIWEDPFGAGVCQILTYNTAKNVPTEMWVDDAETFWEFKLVVNLNYDAATFSTDDFVDNGYYPSQVKITDGKILYGAATTPSGMPADSIVFNVWFDDDDYADAGYWDHFRVSGYRRTGLAGDEPEH